MKKYYYYLVLFLIPNLVFSQQISGELITPNIPFPNKILGNKIGHLLIYFEIDGYGKIKSYSIQHIELYKIPKKNSVKGRINKLVYHKDMPEYTTKEGIELAEKI